MTLYELFTRQLMKTQLFEMAFSLADAQRMITSSTPTIIEHLIKLWVFESPANVPGWSRTVNVRLSKINQIKLSLPRKKKLSSSEILDLMQNHCYTDFDYDFVDRFVADQLDEYPQTVVVRTDWNQVLDEIWMWIESTLSDVSSGRYSKIGNYPGINIA